jgi:hypothetical protein
VGAQGAAGVTGATGATGATGQIGPTGATASISYAYLAITGNYSNTVTPKNNEAVNFNTVGPNNGVTISNQGTGPNSGITINTAGIYLISYGFSPSTSSSGAVAGYCEIFTSEGQISMWPISLPEVSQTDFMCSASGIVSLMPGDIIFMLLSTQSNTNGVLLSGGSPNAGQLGVLAFLTVVQLQ